MFTYVIDEKAQIVKKKLKLEIDTVIIVVSMLALGKYLGFY